jgi:hypothetical protein
LSKPWLKPGQYKEYELSLHVFLNSILLQPYHLAFRRAKYGYNLGYHKTLSTFVEVQKKYQLHNKYYFRFCLKKAVKSFIKILKPKSIQ